MYVTLLVFNGDGEDLSPDNMVHRAHISFPWGLDETGRVIRVLMYKPLEWLNVWEREMLIDGKPHKVRLSIMEDSSGSGKETQVSRSSAQGSSDLKPEDIA